MNFRFYEPDEIKEKFAFLIAKLHEASLLIEYINKVIVESSFFDCFENNNLDDFINMSYETITREIFKKEVIFDNNTNLINEYYWAGEAVINIMMNLQVPLKRILIIYPLKEIVSDFAIYHEMHPIQLLDHYKDLEDQRGLVRILRDEKDMMLTRIGYLTNINIHTLRLMEKSNAILFATSVTNLSRLANIFNVSFDVFKKESSFIPVSYCICQNEEFKKILTKAILELYSLDADSKCLITNIIDPEEIRKILENNQVVISLSNQCNIVRFSNNKIVCKNLTKNEFMFLYKKASIEFKNSVQGLLY